MRTPVLLLPIVFLFGCHPAVRPTISPLNNEETKLHNSDIPVSTDTAKAVSLITRVRSFSADGLNVLTIARSLQGENKRIEMLPEMEEDSSINIEIHRQDLKKLFRLDPKNKTFMELPPQKKQDASPAKSKSGKLLVRKTKLSDCQSKTEINGPGPIVQIDNRSAQLYKVNTKMVCRDKKTRKEIRRYNYREYLWVSNKILRLDPAIRVSTETLYSYDMLVPVEEAPEVTDSLTGRSDIAAESSNLIKQHTKTVLAIEGMPVRRDQVTTTIWNGKETPFTPSEKSNYVNWQSDIAPPTDSPSSLRSSTTTAKTSATDFGKPRIPEWVLSVDPAFAKHGGVAKRVDYLDIQVRNPKGLFDVPSQYQKVQPPK